MTNMSPKRARALSPRARGLVMVRADASNPAAVLAELNKAFEAFKAENDKNLADIRKGLGDAVQADKVDRINAEIDKLRDQMVAVASQASMAASAGAGANDEAAQIRTFSATLRGREITPEAFRDYKKGLNAYLRVGPAADAAVLAALSVGSDPAGGYTVTPDMSGRIIKKVYETSPMRQLADVQTIGTDALEGFNDLDEASAGWVGETGSRSETNTPALGKWSIPVHEIYAMPKATQKLLDDSSWDIEAWLIDKVTDKFIRTENAAFFTGNGVLKPRGLLDYSTAATPDSSRAWGIFEHVGTGASGAFPTLSAGTVSPADVLVDLVFKLKAKYRQNANWAMARSTLAAIRKIKDADSNYVWQPNFAARDGGLILGHSVVEAEDMPAIGANTLSVAFGDFKEGYTIVDRVGIRALRDPLTAKGFVLFYMTKRVGGGAGNFEAVKFLKFA